MNRREFLTTVGGTASPRARSPDAWLRLAVWRSLTGAEVASSAVDGCGRCDAIRTRRGHAAARALCRRARAQPALPALAANGSAAAHLQDHGWPALERATGWRLGEARLRTARSLQRPLSVCVCAHARACRRPRPGTQRPRDGRRVGGVSGEDRQRLSQRVSRGALRSLEGRTQGLGAVLHVPQDPGRPSRSLHAHRQHRRARRRGKDGGLGTALAERRQRRASAAHPSDRVRRHERGALQPRRRDEEGGIPGARTPLRAAELFRPAGRSS